MPRTQGSQDARDRSRPTSRRPDDEERRHDDQQGGDQRSGGSGGRGAPVKSSHIIEEHIDLGVPRDVAYDQWTRYQDLAKYSKHESGKVKREGRVSFGSKIGPSSRGWDAQIAEQVPGKRIAWRSIGGAQHMGVVTFHRLDDRLTRMMVQMEYHPAGALETIGNFLRMQRRRVRKDLRLFKHFIELKGEPEGKGTGKTVSGDGLRQETDERLGSQGENGRGADTPDNGDEAKSRSSEKRRAS